MWSDRRGGFQSRSETALVAPGGGVAEFRGLQAGRYVVETSRRASGARPTETEMVLGVGETRSVAGVFE